MKRKKLIGLVGGVFSFAAVAVVGTLALNNGIRFIRVNGEAGPHTYTITADDFHDGNGSFSVGGEQWNYTDVSVSGDTVTLSGVLYTTTFSGASASGGYRGNGYTRMLISELDKSSAVGLVVYDLDSKSIPKATLTNVTADMDLTNSGAVANTDRRGVQFAQAGGGSSSFSFKSITLYYDCVEVVPQVLIDQSNLSVGVGEDGSLTASTIDVYAGDTPEYVWASDDDTVATVVGSGKNATVTGVGAGKTNITVSMSLDGGKTYTDDTIEVTVTAAAATVQEMKVLDTSRPEGAGIFCRFNPSTAGVTANQLDTYTATVAIEFADPNTNNAINHYVFQEKGDSSYTAYVVCDSAVGLANAFTVTADFKDMTNNVIYRAVWHFDGGKLAPEIVLTASGFSVNEGDDLEIVASKAAYLDGEPEFQFAIADDTVATIAVSNDTVTVTGVKEGATTLTVTMTIGSDTYTVTKQIAVTAAGVQHLITWYTEGTNNQRNHWEGAGVWLWVNYGALGYNDFGSFSAQKSNMTATCSKTGIRVEVISDDIAALKVCRVYLVANAAETTSVIEMTIPDANGVTYTGSITFVNGEATLYNEQNLS